MSNVMSYPLYSLANKSQKSKGDNFSNNLNFMNKRKKNKNSGEFEVEMNSGIINENNMNDSNNYDQKLKNKYSKKIQLNDNKSNKKNNNNYNKPNDEGEEQENNFGQSKKKFSDDIKNESIKFLKNKNKSHQKNKKKDLNLNSSNSKNDEDENESNNNNNRKHNHKKNSYSSGRKENVDDSSENKGNKKKRKEKKKKEGKQNENDENNKSESSSIKKINHKRRKNSKTSDSSKEKMINKVKEKNNSNLSDEKVVKKMYNSLPKQEDLKQKMEKTGLPMVEREDLKNYINSRIIYTKKELQMVKDKIIKNKKHLHTYLDLLYRASVDGDYEERIIALSEGVYPQVILFYTEDGARFGIYIEKEKHISFFGNVSYKEIPGTSFLISLNSLKTYDILDGKTASDNRPEKLCFGRSYYYNNNESNWLIYTPKNEFLNKRCMIGDKESTFGIINTKEIVGIKKEYILVDVEIYQAIMYPEEDANDGNN